MQYSGVEVQSPEVLEQRVGLAQTGDTEALRQLCWDFRPLVHSVARRYKGVSYEDAVQEGYLAFIKALQVYDATRGIPFLGFVARRVHGDVRTAMRKEWRYAERTAFIHEPDEEWDSRTVWEEFSYEQWRNFRGTGGEMDLHQVELDDLISRASLSSRERFGLLESLKGYSSTDIAKKTGVSAETVKTWRKRALRKIRKALENHS